MAIGSLATLDLPMVVDLIGIYGLKGPYCTLTTTDWFLQALSVIPRGSWGDVARRFTMIRWAEHAAAAAAADRRRTFVSGQFDEENPFMLILSALLVQPDEGVSDLVMDRIGVIYREEPGSCNSGWSQAQVPTSRGADPDPQQVLHIADASLKFGRPYPHFDGPID
ncbi:acyl-CoA dehydrogenase-related protein [Dorcoceras hygrometricum]|uniref:Acyl-CoA dehydrogenase-related protein n=1 Tax=Dorcoceras hygrometricum TaxID=472368 RepID=A0A2Z7BUU3_9LAMI|nr:acyl-CoA dehydrogenase-related protein [Dorcoceras hygrometricum]